MKSILRPRRKKKRDGNNVKLSAPFQASVGRAAAPEGCVPKELGNCPACPIIPAILTFELS